jgi:hypothetical protein
LLFLNLVKILKKNDRQHTVFNSNLLALNSLSCVMNSEFPKCYWKTHVTAQVVEVYDLEKYRDLSEKVNSHVSSDSALLVSEEDT